MMMATAQKIHAAGHSYAERLRDEHVLGSGSGGKHQNVLMSTKPQRERERRMQGNKASSRSWAQGLKMNGR